MHLTVNGEPRELPAGSRLSSLVGDQPGVAVALNGVVVRAAAWPSIELRERDRVEIVTARQGG
jgi:sulfur carrier protein